MNDKRIKMDCPFCHTPNSQIQIKVIVKNKYATSNLVYLSCPKCGCTFIGNSKIDVIDRWNCR